MMADHNSFLDDLRITYPNAHICLLNGDGDYFLVLTNGAESFQTIPVCSGETVTVTLWMRGVSVTDQAEGLMFWIGLVEPDTANILGTIDSTSFGYY